MATTFFQHSLLVLLLVGLTCLYLSAADDQVVQMEQAHALSNEAGSNEDDVGRLTSCLDPPLPFVFQWKPKILKPQKSMTFNFSIELADEFKSGNASVTIWLLGIEDPIYKDSGLVQCDKMQPVIEKLIPDFRCPIKSGYVLKKVFPYKLDPSIPLPAGDYKIEIKFQNEKQKVVLCAEGFVSIKDQ